MGFNLTTILARVGSGMQCRQVGGWCGATLSQMDCAL